MSAIPPACTYVKPQVNPEEDPENPVPRSFSGPNMPPLVSPNENSQRMAPAAKALEALQKKSGSTLPDPSLQSPKKNLMDQILRDSGNPCTRPQPKGDHPEIIPCV
jgi:hypothetical protein